MRDGEDDFEVGKGERKEYEECAVERVEAHRELGETRRRQEWEDGRRWAEGDGERERVDVRRKPREEASNVFVERCVLAAKNDGLQVAKIEKRTHPARPPARIGPDVRVLNGGDALESVEESGWGDLQTFEQQAQVVGKVVDGQREKSAAAMRPDLAKEGEEGADRRRGIITMLAVPPQSLG